MASYILLWRNRTPINVLNLLLLNYFIETPILKKKETPILWPPDAESWLIWKTPDAGKDWEHEVKGTIEVEMVGWHHRHNGHGFGWTPGIGDGQGGLVCCGSWGRKELDTTEQLNWTETTYAKLTCMSKALVFKIMDKYILKKRTDYFGKHGLQVKLLQTYHRIS